MRAYNRLLKAIEPLLASSNYDPGVLDNRLPAWRDAVDEELVPEVSATYIAGLLEDAREGVTLDAQAYAADYLTTVHNRLVGVSDYVFDQVAGTLQEGMLDGESIPELAARVDALFTDAQRWRNRAVVVARTEVPAAMNAGHQRAAAATADALGVPVHLVAKEWLATHDTRTRPTHRAADGQQVLGLTARFTVGEAQLERPGDVAGPPDEVIQCRCTALYSFPGDLDYPTGLTAGGTTMAPSRSLHRAHALSAAGTACADHPCVCTGCDEFDCGLDACACCWTYDEEGTELLLTPEHPDAAALEALAAAGVLEAFDVSTMPPKLQAYWLGPKGAAKIGYGTPGQFKRCQAALRGKVPGHMIDGTCSNLIHKATGQWPGKHGDGHAAAAASTWAVDTENPMVPVPAGVPEQPPDVMPAHDPAMEQHDEACIVALPAGHDTTHGIGPEDKHCTLLYLGAVDPEGATQQPLASLVQHMAATTAPFTAAVDQVGQLGPDEQQCDVWLLNSEDNPLPQLHAQAKADPTCAAMIQGTDQFPTYTPHVTIGWPHEQGDSVDDSAWPAILDAASDVGSVTFDRLALWHGNDRTEYPLTGAPAAGSDTPPAGTAPATPPAKEDDAPVTSAATEPAPQPSIDAATNVDLTWSGILCPEGLVTGDKRKFAPDSILWMEDPGVLKAMFSDQPGHDGSVPVGIIKSIERTDGKLPFSGTWSTGPEAEKARQWNIDGRLRGVSVDLDDVEMHLEDDQGNVLEGDAIWDLEVEPTLVIDKGRVRAATLWCTPAYVEAYVLDSTVATEVPKTSIVDARVTSPLAVAAAGALTVTEPAPRTGAAPAAAFANPGLEEPTCLTVTDDGRVFGHLATWGTCHIGIEGACVTPPQSETDYAYFATGMYATSDGEVLPVGAITMGTGHADLQLGWRPTVDHYDHTGTAAAFINIGEDPIGIWFAGALAEDLPDAQRLALQRAGSVSGDWRTIGGHQLELVAALAVNVPGFPIPRVASRVASVAAAGGRIQPTALVASGIVRPSDRPMAMPTIKDLAREVAAYQARQTRLDAARARVRKARQLAAAGRLNRKG